MFFTLPGDIRMNGAFVVTDPSNQLSHMHLLFSLVFALETNTKIKMHVKCQNVRIAGLRGVVGASKRGPTA